jgi:hypothetical protein
MHVFCRLFCRFPYVFREHVTLRVYENLQCTVFMRDRAVLKSMMRGFGFIM